MAGKLPFPRQLSGHTKDGGGLDVVGYQGCGRKKGPGLMRWVDGGVTGLPWWDKSYRAGETGERAGGRQSEFYTKGGELGVSWKEWYGPLCILKTSL